MPRKTYKKRTYKKRTYKARRYKRRYYKRRYYRKPLKKPEIHISSDNIEFSHTGLSNGTIKNITAISSEPIPAPLPAPGDNDLVQFNINGKHIEGRKIRLKYLYIKGYLYSVDNNINGKLYIFRRKKNVSQNGLAWSSLMELPINLNDPSSWTTENINDILYKYDWKNDINNQIKKKVKLIYKSYDNNNNYIPFKIRIPLYDCVLTCDSYYSISNQQWVASEYPSTNALFISYVTNANMGENSTHTLKLKYKLYYTDY